MRDAARRAAAVLMGAVLASLPALAPAHATHTLLHLGGGTLSISQPATSSLGTAPVGSTSLQARLGTVTVNDTRGLVNLGSYTVRISSTGFTTTGDGTASYTIPAANVFYSPPATIGGSGTATRAPGAGGSLDQSRVAMTAALVAGNNTSVWDPTITVSFPADAIAGTYIGTITHSVA